MISQASNPFIDHNGEVMTMKSSTKFGIIFIGTFSLLMLSSLALSDFSHDSIKLTNNPSQENTELSNNADEPIIISSESVSLKCSHEDLNNYSDVVVIGTVKKTLPSKWNTIDGKQPDKELNDLIPGVDVIYTDTVVNVDKYLKNPLSSKEIVVRRFIGTVGNVSIESDDEPSLKPGEKVLLYLSKDTSLYTNVGSEHFLITGASQGKFKLTDDGKAVRPDETVSQDELLSTIKK